MRLRTHISDNRGMSLVEVLAALAVFVVGILVIVRMFPPGFLVVKQSENVTLANRLAQAELERLKGSTSNLPAGILGWDIVNGGVLIDVNPEDLGELPGLSGMSSPPDSRYYSDVNKFRRIYAESTRIPAPMTTPLWGDVSMYVVNFSPIEWAGTTSITVRSGPMRRRSVPESPRTVRSSSEYAVDYNNAVLHVRPTNYDREFVISYSYWSQVSGRPELRPVLSARVFIPRDAANVEIPNGNAASPSPVKNETGYMFIDNGSDTLHRSFMQIDASAAWDPDNPYQYKVLDTLRGVVGFNPAGYGYEEFTEWGRVPLTAYIDYNVLDWHIIREDRKIPDTVLSEADLGVKLTLRFIKNAAVPGAAPSSETATVEFDGSRYTGLAPGLDFSILAIDIQTGEWFNEESSMGSGQWAMVVNYKDGIVRFHPSLAGRTFRIYYRAEGDWALQVFKAFESYRRSYNFSAGSSSPLDHREWYGPTSDAGGVEYFSDKIYFARCYSGMSVALDYTYRIAGNAEVFTVDGDTYRTSEATGFQGTCYIEPRERIAKLRNVSVGDVQILGITRVNGVSVGTRVIWREGGRGFNAGRWRSVDLQTYLMRLQD